MTKTLKWWSEFCCIFFFFLCERWSRISFGFCGLLWSRRQMKLNIEKEPWRVRIQCCGNYCLLKCTERWISCLVGIIRQVFWGKQAARTLHNDAFQWGWLKLLPRAWLALARVFLFIHLFIFICCPNEAGSGCCVGLKKEVGAWNCLVRFSQCSTTWQRQI